jgi:hypothetical protein
MILPVRVGRGKLFWYEGNYWVQSVVLSSLLR